MTLSCCIVTLNRYDLLCGLINSAERGTIVPDHYYIIDNGRNLLKRADNDIFLEDMSFAGRITVITPSKCQVSLGEAWNWFLENIEGDKVFPNDDVLFHEHTIEKLLIARNENKDEIFFCSGGVGALNAFSLWFVDDRFSHGAKYRFDPHFYPAYYEDNDMARRLELDGHRLFSVDNCTADHLGSATVKAYTEEQMQRHHAQFRRNTAYYIAKWGGLPHHETYTQPFAGEWSEKEVFEYLKQTFGY